jgi:hypothetical protein
MERGLPVMPGKAKMTEVVKVSSADRLRKMAASGKSLPSVEPPPPKEGKSDDEKDFSE